MGYPIGQVQVQLRGQRFFLVLYQSQKIGKIPEVCSHSGHSSIWFNRITGGCQIVPVNKPIPNFSHIFCVYLTKCTPSLILIFKFFFPKMCETIAFNHGPCLEAGLCLQKENSKCGALSHAPYLTKQQELRKSPAPE